MVYKSVNEKYNNFIDDLREEAEELINLQPISGKDFMSLQFTDPKWLIEGYLLVGGLTMLASPPGAWKTWLSFLITKSITTGEKFLNKFSSIQGNVLLINEENIPRELQERMQTLGMDGSNFFLLSRKNFRIDDRGMLERIQQLKKDLDLKLIIIDNLSLVHSAEENNAKEITQIWKALRSLTLDGCSVLTLHHYRKKNPNARPSTDNIIIQEMVRGSYSHISNQDSVITIEPLPNEENGDRAFLLQHPKVRGAKEQDTYKILVKMQGDLIKSFDFMGKYDSTLSSIQKLSEMIVDILFKEDRWMTVKDFLTFQIGKEPIIRKALKSLTLKNIILEKNAFDFSLATDKRTKVYRLSSSDSDIERQKELIF